MYFCWLALHVNLCARKNNVSGQPAVGSILLPIEFVNSEEWSAQIGFPPDVLQIRRINMNNRIQWRWKCHAFDLYFRIYRIFLFVL